MVGYLKINPLPSPSAILQRSPLGAIGHIGWVRLDFFLPRDGKEANRKLINYAQDGRFYGSLQFDEFSFAYLVLPVSQGTSRIASIISDQPLSRQADKLEKIKTFLFYDC